MESTVTQSPAELRTESRPASVLAEGATVTAAEREEVVELPGTDSGNCRPYDFRQQPAMGELERRKLEAEHRRFLQELTTRITLYLRTDCELTLETMRMISFRQFTSALPDPMHVTLFKIEARPGICLWEVQPALALSLTDRLMGGPGALPEQARALSEIEVALLDHLGEMVLEQWCQTWTSVVDWKTSLLGHETERRYLRTSPPETAFLQLKVKVRLGETTGEMQLAFPVNTLDPLVQLLRRSLASQDHSAPSTAAAPVPAWNAALDEVDVPLKAELPPVQISARRMTALNVGDEIPLPASFAEQVRLKMGGLDRYVGRLGLRDNHWAVEVSQILKR